MSRLLVVMGSGETTPTMIKTHRRIFESLPVDGSAVIMDTPYGFQLNADEISAKAVGYFAQSVGRQVRVVSWRRNLPAGLARERALAELRAADWIFAGPGSPSYTLRQWRDTELPGLLATTDVLIFASAAALTLGSHTIPVYEIYKAGADPHWLPGFDLFHQLTGVPAVVIPHYDNAEGGHHDTRFCYLGEPRLRRMEAELPQRTVIVGVDEHTALLCDLVERRVTVVGNGTLTLRRAGHSAVFAASTVLPFSTLAEAGLDLRGDPAAGAGPTGAGGAGVDQVRTGSYGTERDSGGGEPTSLRQAADEADRRFGAALADWDVDGCVGCWLDLEQAIEDWTADTLASDDGPHARAVLRGMAVRLGELAATGAQDLRPQLAPLVEALLAQRRDARAQRDWTASDRIRDTLAAAGVTVRDTPDGALWSL
jgi:cyanophycinase-like exopeptidase